MGNLERWCVSVAESSVTWVVYEMAAPEICWNAVTPKGCRVRHEGWDEVDRSCLGAAVAILWPTSWTEMSALFG